MIQLNQNYYYNNLEKDVYYLADKYSDLIQTEVLGLSHDGRKIFLIILGKGKKKVLCTGGVHGRESINPIVLMKMIEVWADPVEREKFSYPWNEIFREYSFYFIPLLNPDGYMIALRGFNIIRNEPLRMNAKIMAKKLGIAFSEWKFNARGIDINRNFPSIHWAKKTETDTPASENETKILMHLMDGMNSIGYIDYHSRGELIYYYRSQMTGDYNVRQKAIAENLQKMTGYILAHPSEEIEIGDSGGNTVHYYCENTKMPAFTIETIPEDAVFPLSIHYQEDTFHKIWSTPLVFTKS